MKYCSALIQEKKKEFTEVTAEYTNLLKEIQDSMQECNLALNGQMAPRGEENTGTFIIGMKEKSNFYKMV